MTTKPCKNAGNDENHLKRPAPHPGPRCTTCHRAVVKDRKRVVAFRRTERTYGVDEAAYDALYAAQGGKCACCQRATGKTKRLAVDHDHSCTAGHDPKTGCKLCVRGLLCGPCNRLVGMLGDDAEAFMRFVKYLRNPPARAVLKD